MTSDVNQVLETGQVITDFVQEKKLNPNCSKGKRQQVSLGCQTWKEFSWKDF